MRQSERETERDRVVVRARDRKKGEKEKRGMTKYIEEGEKDGNFSSTLKRLKGRSPAAKVCKQRMQSTELVTVHQQYPYEQLIKITIMLQKDVFH